MKPPKAEIPQANDRQRKALKRTALPIKKAPKRLFLT
jgi:hypothetical protein